MAVALQHTVTPELAAKISAAIAIYQQEFPDAQAYLSPFGYLNSGYKWISPDSIVVIEFNQPLGGARLTINFNQPGGDVHFDPSSLSQLYHLEAVELEFWGDGMEVNPDEHPGTLLYIEELDWETLTALDTHPHAERFERIAQQVYNSFQADNQAPQVAEN